MKFVQKEVKANILANIDDFLVIDASHTILVQAFKIRDEEALLLRLTFDTNKD